MDVLNITGYQRRTPHVVAECKGFFAKEQLELNFHRTTFAPDHNRGMAEGRWDFTLSSADTMIARTTTDGVDVHAGGRRAKRVFDRTAGRVFD